MRDLDPIFLEKRINELEKNGGGGGTTDYNNLSNKPKIENVELIGNKTFEDLGIASAEDLSQTNDDLLDVTQEVNSLITNVTYFSDGRETIIGKIDNKNLYRKFLRGKTNNVSSNWKTIEIGTNIEAFNVFGLIKPKNESFYSTPINYSRSTALLIAYQITETNFAINVTSTDTNYLDADFWVCIDYTKTTD